MITFIRPMRAALTAAAVLVAFQGVASALEVRCSSRDNERRTCEVDTSGGVRLVQRMSNSPCIEGNTWGFDQRGIWVDEGCRAVFDVGDRSQGDAVGTIFGTIYGDDGYRDSPERYDIPSWAIGVFRGRDPVFGTVELRITADGAVYASSRRGLLEGDYFDGAMILENTAFRLSHSRNGMRADPVDGGEPTYYQRIR